MKVRSFSSFYNQLLPDEYGFNSAYELFKSKLTNSHSLAIFSVDRNYLNRNMKIAILFGKVSNCVVATMILVFALQNKNSSCSAYLTSYQCERHGDFTSVVSLCLWESVSQKCSRGGANKSFALFVSIAYFSSLLALALDKILNCLISHFAVAIKHSRLSWVYEVASSMLTYYFCWCFTTRKAAKIDISVNDFERSDIQLAKISQTENRKPQKIATSMEYYGDELQSCSIQSKKAT